MAKTDVELVQTGDYKGHWQGPYEVTPDDLERMAQNFSMEVVIDYEHATHNPEADKAPAAGWIQNVWVDGESLYGEVEWTEAAEELIDNGEYRYLSPVINLHAADPNTGNGIGAKLVSVGLVNTPFMEEMESVQNDGKGELGRVQAVSRELVVNNKFQNNAASGDDPSDAPEPTDQPQQEDPTMDERLQKFLNKIASVLGINADDELDVLDETRQLKQNSQKLEEKDSTIEELQSTIEEQQTTIEELQGKLEAQQEEADEEILNRAIEQGKIRKNKRDFWAEQLEENRENTVAILNNMDEGQVLPGKGDGPEEPKKNTWSIPMGTGGKMLEYVDEQAEQAG